LSFRGARSRCHGQRTEVLDEAPLAARDEPWAWRVAARLATARDEAGSPVSAGLLGSGNFDMRPTPVSAARPKLGRLRSSHPLG